jgi:putative transposase
MVKEMLAARGISVSYETIRQWGLKFGREFANRIRRRAPRRGDKWHLDEVVITIAGEKHWLWRAVDQEGFVLDVLVQSRRDKKAAKRLLRKLLKKQGQARYYGATATNLSIQRAKTRACTPRIISSATQQPTR